MEILTFFKKTISHIRKLQLPQEKLNTRILNIFMVTSLPQRYGGQR